MSIDLFLRDPYMLDFRYEDMHLSGNFGDYSNDQLSEFVDQYRAHAIPDISRLSH